MKLSTNTRWLLAIALCVSLIASYLPVPVYADDEVDAVEQPVPPNQSDDEEAAPEETNPPPQPDDEETAPEETNPPPQPDDDETAPEETNPPPQSDDDETAPEEPNPSPQPDDEETAPEEPIPPLMQSLNFEGTIHVTSRADTPGGDCPHVSDCTLRAAIQLANEQTGDVTIQLREPPAGQTDIYQLEIPGEDDIAQYGDLDLTGTIGTNSITIIGPGPEKAIIDGGRIDRVFDVLPADNIDFTIEGVTIRNGKAADFGGGIQYSVSRGGSLTLRNTIIEDNNAELAGGGLEIYSTGAARVIIEQSIIRNNSTGGDGGGINVSDGSLSISNTTISENIAVSAGGGLSVQADGRTTTIVGSTFSANHAGSTGGALSSVFGTINVYNSTFSGNSARSRGGAIYYDENNENLTLIHATITGNCIKSSAGAYCPGTPEGTGGGLYEGTNAGGLVLRNSIIIGNSAGTEPEAFISNPDPSNSNNIIGGVAAAILDPVLRANGGYTMTHALVPGSAALDAGVPLTNPPGVNLAADQRGAERGVDAPGDPGNKPAAPDIGAFEAHAFIWPIADQSVVGSLITINFPIGNVLGVTVDGEVTGGATVVGDRSGGIGTLTITPAASGTIEVTAKVIDAVGYIASTKFKLTVTLKPQQPEISGADSMNEDEQSERIIITSADSAPYFKISSITNGKLYQNNGSTQIPDGAFITAAEGAAGLKFTPDQDFNGTASFDVQAASVPSESGLSDPVTVSLTVHAVNDPPVTGIYVDWGTLEDSDEIRILVDPRNGDKPGPSTALDEKNQTLRLIGATGNPQEGTVRFVEGQESDQWSGQIYYTPAENFHGTATITYTIEDSGGATNTGTILVPVTPIADRPDYTDATTQEDTQSSSGLVLKRNRADGEEVTHFQITEIWNGRLFLNNGTTEISGGDFITYAQGNQGLKFTPAADLYSPKTMFGFTVSAATSATGHGLSDMVFVPIIVIAVNDLPVGYDDQLDDQAEDTGPWLIPFAAVVGNDDPGAPNEDDQILDVASVTNAVGGMVAIEVEEQAIIFTPYAHYNGPASFEYIVRDNGAAPNTATATAKVTFTITEVNDPPEGVDDVLSAIDEDSPPRRIAIASLVANDRGGPEGVADEEAQELTFVGVDGAFGGSVEVDDDEIVFTLAPNHYGLAGFTYTIRDNGTTAGVPDPKTGTASVTFWVNNIAEQPNVTPATTAEDTKSSSGLVITPDAADGGTVTHFRISGITGGLLYLHDGETPITDGDYIEAAEGAKGLKFMPAPDLHSPDVLFGFTVYAALDAAGTGLSPGASVSITVTEVNDPPIADDDTVGDIEEDSGDYVIAAVTLLANDRQGAANESDQELSITDVDNVVGGTAKVNADGDVVFTPTANYAGPASFRYTVTDNGTTAGAPDPLSDTATVSFNITPIPDEPQITVAPTAEDEATTIRVEPHAADLVGITHFILTGAAGGSVYLDGAPMAINDTVTVADALTKLVFAPTPDRNSPADGDSYFRVSFKAYDSGRNVAGPEATAIVTVTEVNDAPTGLDDAFPAMVEDFAPKTFTAAALLANDSKGPANESDQTLKVIAVTAIDGGTVTLDEETQLITFTPWPNFYGTARFRYTVEDNGTTNGVADPKSDTAIVSFEVTSVPDPPQITPTTTAEDTRSTTGLVITRHPDDGVDITHFKITAITGGELYLSDGTTVIADGDFIDAVEAGKGLRFMPAKDLNTPAGDTFGFVAHAALDGAGTGLSAGTAVSITVTEVNDAPVAVSELLTPGIEEDSGTHRIPLANLTANDQKGAENESGQILTVIDVAGIDGGEFDIEGTDLLFTPDPNFHGTAYFRYTVEDNGTTAGVADFRTSSAVSGILVTPVADTPTITATTTAEETQSTTGLEIFPSEVDGAEVTHFQITGIAGGKLYHSNGLTEIENGDYITIAAGAAGLKFTPAKDLNSPAGHSFTFTVKAALNSAGTGISDGVNATITVTAVNDAPVAVDDTLPARDEDSGPWTIPFTALTGNDLTGADDEDDDLTVDSIDWVTGGTVFISGTDVVFKPTEDFNGTASFQYWVRDNGTTAGAPDPKVSAAPATVTIPVTPVNDAPVTVDITLDPVVEDSPSWTIPIAKILAGDTPGPANESDQTLTLTAVTAVSGGTPTIEGSNIRFTLTRDFHGLAEFTYDVTDTGTPALTSTGTVRFRVTPVAEPPVATATTTAEDTQSTTGLVISRDDADGPEVTHFKITAISGGRLYLKDGTTQIDHGDFITVDQGGEGLRFTPDYDRNTPADGPIFGFIVQGALDNAGAGISGGTYVAITVTEVNDEPTGVDDAFPAMVEDFAPKTFTAAALLANDSKGPANESGQTLRIIAVDSAVGGAVDLVDGDVVFTPTPDFYGDASFRYTLEDDGTTAGADDFKTSTAAVRFEITPMPDTPRISPATTAEDTMSTAGLVVLPHPNDGPEVTHFVVTGITGGRLLQNDGITELQVGDEITVAEGAAGLKFDPAEDLNSLNTVGDAFTVSLSARDSVLNRMGPAGTASITVTEVNDAPTGVADALQDVLEDSGPWIIPVAELLQNDIVGPHENGQTLTVTAVDDPTGGTVALVGTDVIFSPFAHFNGTASFRYTVIDNGTTNGLADPQSDTAVASFTVIAVNDAPIAADDTLPDPVDEDSGPLAIPFATLLANDLPGPAYEDDQTLTIVAVAIDPAVGTVALSGTDVIFTPALNFNGTATFAYTVEDDGKTDGTDDPLTATATVSITVTPINDAPVAHDSSFSLTVGNTVRGNVTATDVEQDPLTFALVGAPTRGTVTMDPDDGSYSYTARQTGTDQFTFKANDGTDDSNIATVTITIRSEPFVPVLTMSVPVTETRESSIEVTGTTNPTHYVTVNGTTVMADGAGNWSATVTLVEGPNTITASMAPLSRTATVVRDTTPPVIVLTASETRTEAESVVLTVTTEEGARVTIEGQETSTLTVPLQMGQNRFTATAIDRLGNQATASISVLRIGKVPPVLQEIEPGKPGEATMQNFRVHLPGDVATEPLLLRVLSPTADTAAVLLADGAAEIAATADVDVATQADNTPLQEVTATVTFSYDPKAVSNPADLRIYYFDTKWKVWVELGGVVDHQQNTITVEVGHFTTFAAMVPQVAAPVLPALPAEVETDKLTVTGTAPAETPVSLVINGESQVSVMTDKNGRYTMMGTLVEGRNWVYVKGTGALASREWAVTYQPAVLYTDIGGHWAEGTINRLAQLRIASIYSEPLFQPEARVTRLEFAVMVARALGLAPVNEAPAFTDTDSMPMWARPEVAAAVKAGIIQGMPDGSFAPNALVTRAEMAVMLTRALHYAGQDVTPGDRHFTDQEQIPVWALDQVLTAARYGLITGYPDASFQPANTTTRAEAVTMLGRLFDQVAGEKSGM